MQNQSANHQWHCYTSTSTGSQNNFFTFLWSTRHTWQAGHCAGALPSKFQHKRSVHDFRGWMSWLQAYSIWQPLQNCSIMVKRNGIMNKWAAVLLKVSVLKLQKPLCTVRTQQEMQPWKFSRRGNWALSSPSFQTEQISQEKKLWGLLNFPKHSSYSWSSRSKCHYNHSYKRKVLSLKKQNHRKSGRSQS